jgi:hypothetical protein
VGAVGPVGPVGPVGAVGPVVVSSPVKKNAPTEDEEHNIIKTTTPITAARDIYLLYRFKI